MHYLKCFVIPSFLLATPNITMTNKVLKLIYSSTYDDDDDDDIKIKQKNPKQTKIKNKILLEISDNTD